MGEVHGKRTDSSWSGTSEPLKSFCDNFLVIQWLGLCPSTTSGLGSTPGHVCTCVCVPEQMRGQHRLPSRSQPTATSSSNWKAVSRAAWGLDSRLPCPWATIRAVHSEGKAEGCASPD